ncbi:putative glycolipid-binding domain-containing protein [Kushneria konosiri]|uniref:Glycolipid-binding domain-containing protein n=1 Tax=Kushneria konosiri TaxID=698828 RepID=A0A2Z2H4W6_9GAMM|nr:putative glycolipid-binding domain-containing protein [Kushneria konosiri]ARS52373.1 hypothetical protein B9G99_05330 [Kushneria konosiri]
MQREVAWTGWDHQGCERLELTIAHDGITAESRVEGCHDGQGYQLSYQLVLDPAWRMRQLSARLDDGRSCQLSSDGQGRWWCQKQGPLTALSGCIDIDIAVTPFTNTLPIRRLGLEPGESTALSVVLLSVPSLDIGLMRQRYTRLSSHGWRYEGLGSGFTATLEVDDQGLVLDYPDTFRRQRRADPAF